MSGGEARTQGAPFRGPVFAVLEAWFELQKLTLLDVLYVRKGVSDTKEASSAKESPSDARALCLISPIVPDWMRQEAELVKVKWLPSNPKNLRITRSWELQSLVQVKAGLSPGSFALLFRSTSFQSWIREFEFSAIHPSCDTWREFLQLLVRAAKDMGGHEVACDSSLLQRTAPPAPKHHRQKEPARSRRAGRSTAEKLRGGMDDARVAAESAALAAFEEQRRLGVPEEEARENARMAAEEAALEMYRQRQAVAQMQQQQRQGQGQEQEQEQGGHQAQQQRQPQQLPPRDEPAAARRGSEASEEVAALAAAVGVSVDTFLEEQAWAQRDLQRQHAAAGGASGSRLGGGGSLGSGASFSGGTSGARARPSGDRSSGRGAGLLSGSHGGGSSRASSGPHAGPRPSSSSGRSGGPDGSQPWAFGEGSHLRNPAGREVVAAQYSPEYWAQFGMAPPGGEAGSAAGHRLAARDVTGTPSPLPPAVEAEEWQTAAGPQGAEAALAREQAALGAAAAPAAAVADWAATEDRAPAEAAHAATEAATQEKWRDRQGPAAAAAAHAASPPSARLSEVASALGVPLKTLLAEHTAAEKAFVGSSQLEGCTSVEWPLAAAGADPRFGEKEHSAQREKEQHLCRQLPLPLQPATAGALAAIETPPLSPKAVPQAWSAPTVVGGIGTLIEHFHNQEEKAKRERRGPIAQHAKP